MWGCARVCGGALCSRRVPMRTAESMPEMPLVYFEKIRWRTPKCFCRQSWTPCSHKG